MFQIVGRPFECCETWVEVYEGQWADGQAHGFGRFTQANGSYYEGRRAVVWKM